MCIRDRKGCLRRSAARVGDVAHLARVDAERLGDEAREDMIGAARGAAGPRDFRRIGFEGGNEVRHGLHRARGVDDDDLVLARQARDRREVFHRDGRLVRHERAHHDEAGDHHGIALAALGAEELRHADRTAGARRVLELEFLDDALRPEGEFHGPAGLIPASARRCGDEHLQGGRCRLRVALAWEEKAAGARGEAGQ